MSPNLENLVFTRTSLRRRGRNVASRIALEFAVVARVRSRDVKSKCFRVNVRACELRLEEGACALVPEIDLPGFTRQEPVQTQTSSL